jgi:hypothetical protein
LVTRRVTVCFPASEPMEMFGWFRSLGSIEPNSAQALPVADSWPTPHSQRTQSAEVLS